jgi:hypothetical protein
MQRRRGQKARVYRSAETIDNRGNKYFRWVPAEPHEVRAAFIPQRSSRAETPGQVEINVVRMIVDAGLPDVNLWGRVEYDGKEWDIVTPPALHYGTRRTRHWSIDLRERPKDG